MQEPEDGQVGEKLISITAQIGLCGDRQEPMVAARVAKHESAINRLTLSLNNDPKACVDVLSSVAVALAAGSINACLDAMLERMRGDLPASQWREMVCIELLPQIISHVEQSCKRRISNDPD